MEATPATCNPHLGGSSRRISLGEWRRATHPPRVTPISAVHLGELGAIGLDVTADRFVDAEEVSKLDARVKSVGGLWIAGQDSLMCGQVHLSVHRFHSFIDFIHRFHSLLDFIHRFHSFIDFIHSLIPAFIDFMHSLITLLDFIHSLITTNYYSLTMTND